MGLRPRHLLALTVLRDRGASRQQHLAEVRELLARAEMALGATEEIVLGALDRDEREALYTLLARAVDGLAAGCDPLGAAAPSTEPGRV